MMKETVNESPGIIAEMNVADEISAKYPVVQVQISLSLQNT